MQVMRSSIFTISGAIRSIANRYDMRPRVIEHRGIFLQIMKLLIPVTPQVFLLPPGRVQRVFARI
jgi:hypothetical protein